MIPFGTGVEIKEGEYSGSTGFIAGYGRRNLNLPYTTYRIGITLGPKKDTYVDVPIDYVRELGTE